MKKIFSILFFAFVAVNLFSQNYEIDTYNGQTVTTCSGYFYDSGGSGGNYGNNESYTVSFHSNNTINTHIKVYFHEFDIEPTDTLYIYDGATTSAPLIGAYNNINSLYFFPIQANITNASGNLTFKFKSNSSVAGTGWKAEISCIPQCQIVYAALDSVLTIPQPNDSNYIDICLGDTITFVGTGIFPQNNLVYNQSNATSAFQWDFGDGTTATGQTVQHCYTYVKGYDVGLIVTDSHGCVNINYPGIRVRVSGNPIGEIHPLPNICSQSDSLTITVGYDPASVITVVPVISSQGASQGFDSVMFIPDGPNCGVLCYNTNVTFTSFAPGATITSPNDILSICVNMEHSFVGDLSFTITCPNGQSDTLKKYIHSGGAFMGVPYGGINHTTFDNGCNPANNPPGTPWQYCWSQIYPNIGTVNSHSSQSQLDSTNTINNTGYYLPDENFSGLIGCPLNGTWNIQICDNWAIDNGYIFNWDLNLDPSLLPTGWIYDVPIDSIGWSGSFIEAQLDSSIIVYPDSGGIFTYTVTIYDVFGCTYDTTLSITVVNTPEIDLGNDTAICDALGVFLNLDAGNPGADSYLWSTGANTQIIQVNQTGIYIVTVTNTDSISLQCSNIDSIAVALFPMPVVTLGQDTCVEMPITLDAGQGTGYIYNWSTGATTQTINVTNSGTYYVDVQSGVGSPCFDRDTINVKVVPLPVFNLGSDTTICVQRSVTLNASQSNESPEFLYLWTPGGFTSPVIIFSPDGVPGPHTIYVTKTGCITVTDTIIVTGKLCEVTVPNVFTPNGDGVNDFFVIKGLEDYPNTLVQIFNRWGKKIYESSDYKNDWDGEKYHDGVYFFVINFTDYLESMKGVVTIVRN